jgi:hypothetical protein
MWGTVMAMYEREGMHTHMQPSLVSSMKFIYSPPEPGSRSRIELRDLVATAIAWAAAAALAAGGGSGAARRS